MGLIEDHQVPSRRYDCIDPPAVVLADLLGGPTGSCPDRLDRVKRADDLRERTPGVDASVDRHALRPDSNELLPEPIAELGDPLKLHALGRDDQNPTRALS